MKRINKVFVLLAMAAVVFSCAKENPAKEEPVTPTEDQPAIQDLDPSKYLVGFGAAIEGTKVSITPGTGAMAFEDGDNALVVSGTDCGEYVYSVSDGSFSPVDASSAIPMASSGISVYYPFDAFEISGSDVIFKMPAYIESLTDLGDESLTDLGKKNPLAAQVVEDNENGGYKATFKSVCSILQVSITGNRTLSSVELSNTGSKPFASGSEFTVTWSDNNPVITSESTGDTMKIDSSVTLSNKPTVFYFILPAGISFNGVAVTANMTTADAGGFTSFTVTRGDWTPVRNKIFKMDFYAGLFSGGAGTEADPYQIANARDFKHIKTYTTEGYGHTLDAEHFLAAKYQQTADINFGADADHKANLSSYMIGTSAAPFKGKYDGNTYSLNYFSLTGTYPVGLFQYIGAATIDDVVVSGFSVSATKWAAPIVGYVQGAATISNCETSEGAISATNGEAGGIVGRVQVAGTEITDCINGANVTNTTNNNNNLGGIVGYSSADITITGCSNSGTIDNQSGAQVGGIIGRCAAIVTISDCSNSGIIRSFKGIAGGIVGTFATVATVASTVTGCSNTGAVLVSEANADNIGGIVGKMNSGIVSQCRNHGHVGAWSTTDGTSFTPLDVNNHAVGGIVGLMNTGVVQECYSGIPGDTKAWIRGGENIGGIVGCASTDSDEKIYIINCFNRTSAQSSNSGDAPIGGIVGYANANKKQIDIMNCLNWGSEYLLNTNGSNTSSCIGGLVGKGKADGSVNLNIRNCMAANTRATILQRVGSEDKAISELNLETYKTYGLIYGLVSGKTLLRDIYYRSAASGASYMGTNSSTYSGVQNMKTGVSDDVAKNVVETTLNICKTNTETYEFTGYMYAGLTRGSYSPTNASSKLSVGTYNGTTLQLSDWVSVSGMSGYSLPKALVDLGIDYYNR